MQLTSETVTPFLSSPLRDRDASKVAAWLTSIGARFTARYGDRITTDLEPIFVNFAADAIGRRLDKRKSMVDSENTGPAGVKWNSRSTLGGWFLPEEVTEMDQLAGVGGVQTVRTPAPDGIRFGNLADSSFEEADNQ